VTTERQLRTWPCGCREWVLLAVDGDTIEEEATERFEPCREYRNLQAQDRWLEDANAAYVADHGRADNSLVAKQGDVAEKLERHHYGMPDVQTLGG
jgi:hypothetical protein